MVATQRQSESALRRAAILLSHLDAEQRRRLLAHLPPEEASRLRTAAASLADVDPLEVRRVVTAFVGRVNSAGRVSLRQENLQPTTIPPPQSATAERSPRATASTHSATASSGPLSSPAGNAAPTESSPASRSENRQLQFLNQVSDTTLLSAVRSEHPQTVAVVLSSLEPQQAARLLKRLPSELRHEAMRRLGRLEDIPQEVLEDIGRHLKQLVGSIEPFESNAGRRTLTSIFAAMEGAERDALVNGMAASDGVIASALADAGRTAPDTSIASTPVDAAPVRRTQLGATPPESVHRAAPASDAAADAFAAWPSRPVQEEDQALLEQLDPRELQKVLASLDTRQAMLTLCGMSPQAVKRLMRSLPRRQAKDIQNRMAGLGALELREVDAARQAAAASVRRERVAADNSLPSPAEPLRRAA